MRRLLLWIGSLAVAIVSLVIAAPVVTDLAAFIGDDTEGTIGRLVVAEMKEGAGSRSFILTLDDIGTSDEVAERLRRLPFIERIDNGRPPPLNLDDPATRRLFAYRYLLAPKGDFSADGLRHALEERLHDLTSPAAPLLRPMIPADPTFAFIAYLASLRADAPPTGPTGVWSDGDVAYLVGMVSAPLTDERLAILTNEAAPATLSGPAIFAAQSRQRIRAEAEWISLVASSAMLILFLITLRSPRRLLLLALPMLTGGVAGVAAVTLVYGSIQGITLAFGATIVGVAIDYPLHALLHAEGGDRRHESDRLWPTLRLSALTTAVGYGAMLFSDLPGLSQLGLFSIVGVAGAVLSVRYILPPLLPKGPTITFAYRGGSPLAHGMVTLLLIVGATLSLFHEVRWNDDVGRLNPIPTAERLSYEKARAYLAGDDVGKGIVAIADAAEEAMALSRLLTPQLDRLIAEGALTGYRDATAILPDVATQRSRQALLPDRETLTDALATASAPLPFAPGIFAPFVDDVVESRDLSPVTPADLAATPVGPALAPLLHRVGERWVSTTLLAGVKDDSTMATLAASTPGLYYLNLRETISALLADHRAQGLRLAYMGGLLILFLLFLSLGATTTMGKVAANVALPVAATAGFMSLIGPLSLFHLIAFLLVGGLGVDYALFMARAGVERDPRSVASVGLSALSTALVFGILSLSSLPVLQEIGRTTALGVVLLFCAGLASLPRHKLDH